MIRVTATLVLSATDRAAALWSAIAEVEGFYNFDEPRVELRPLLVTALDASLPPDSAVAVDLEALWKRVQGAYSGTVDQSVLAAEMRRVSGASDGLIVVTDREITPPEGYRYLFWDSVPGGVVVSTAAMEPGYWSMSDPDPVGATKHRLRTTCLAIVGSMLGLRRCSNDRCFLYADVDSLYQLDRMVLLGPEHETPGLAGHGFSPREDDPETQAEVSASEHLQAPGDWAL